MLVLQGEPGNYTVVHKDPTVLKRVTFNSYSSSVELGASFSTGLPTGIHKHEFDPLLRTSKTIKVFLYGECGGTGYNNTTNDRHYDSSSTTFTQHTQNNVSGGYLGTGKNIHIAGFFRNYKSSVVNYRRSKKLRPLWNMLARSRQSKM